MRSIAFLMLHTLLKVAALLKYPNAWYKNICKFSCVLEAGIGNDVDVVVIFYVEDGFKH